MQRLCAILCVLLALGFLAGPAKATLLADQPYHIDAQGRLITSATINGQGPFTFLIDTASSRSLIYERVRAQLGLIQSQPERLIVYGINNATSAMPVKPGEVSIGGETMHGLTLGVLPDSPGSADQPDGVLGIDALSRYFVVLDRANMRFKLMAPEGDTGQALDGWTEMALTPRPLKNIPATFWYLRTRFNNTGFITLFDLGAGVTMLNWQAAEKLGVRERDYTQFGPPPDALRDVLGTDAPAVRLNKLKVAARGMIWLDQDALVANAKVFERFDLGHEPAAIVGAGLLENNSLAIDFAGGKLFVGPTMAP